MLPEKLSTDLTSLGEGQDRLAIVVSMTVDPAGTIVESDVYRATVRNRAKLAYNSVAAWLQDEAPAPPRLAAVPGLDEQLRLQDRVAQTAEGGAARSTARSASRRSKRGRYSTATGLPICARRKRTGRRN